MAIITPSQILITEVFIMRLLTAILVLGCVYLSLGYGYKGNNRNIRPSGAGPCQAQRSFKLELATH